MNNHLTILSLVLLLSVSALSAQQKVYVVYLGEHSGEKTFEEIEELHHSYLHSVKGSKEEAKACIIYSYKKVINGFSALLTPEEANTISDMSGVISVFHSHHKSKPQTTWSWNFTSLLDADWNHSKANYEELLEKASYGKNIIVGVLDTGVWPESESFNDVGMEPIPPSWKGICESGKEFNSSHCNRKLVGARYYLRGFEAKYGTLDPSRDFRSPRDITGHGTHTSSTVGGRRVPNAAGIGGFANGTASGGAPLVRLAIYKVCWQIPPSRLRPGSEDCRDEDMLAAFDDAIDDGVQVISVSISKSTSVPYTEDGIAIALGALHAVRRNIVVACSAGNSGPDPSSVTNVSPWIITVGASSIDRAFPSPVVLGNDWFLEGQSVTPFQKGTCPLIDAWDAEIPGTTTNETRGLCLNGTLSPSLVTRKAVFCRAGNNTSQAAVEEVQRAGGIAVVLENSYPGIGVSVTPYSIRATMVLSNETMNIYNYLATNQTHTATLTPAETDIGTKPAPFMAAFSSRGPNFIEPDILKPDITAPGLNILAAWSEAASPYAKYHILSGTSMACPHVAAVAVLLKAIHPDWSSAAIRSAIITTAKQTNNAGNPITNATEFPASPFELGAGHIQPSKAANPGLVYNASYYDYLLFLFKNTPASSLNYPSLSIANLEGSATVTRTVTNVGVGKSSYSVSVDPPPGYSVQISPERLSFSALGEEQSFNITIQVGSSARENEYDFGWYTWSDRIHQVRSTISVRTSRNIPLPNLDVHDEL